MATGELPVITTDQLPVEPEHMTEFDHLVAERQMFKLNEDLAKRCREDCDKRIDAILQMAGPVRVQSNVLNAEGKPLVAQRVTSKSADKLDAKLLLQAGVSASIVASATIKGKEYSYVLVK